MFDDQERRRKVRRRQEERRRRSREELAREHPVRVSILAGLTGEDKALTAREVRDGLPDERPPAVVFYHLAVLREADLVRADGGFPQRYTLAA